MPQLLLFPDPRPLVERLGRSFFRNLPPVAGVYTMRDAAQNVMYVGKAKNLRKRLNNYRVANPDRVARRHLQMLRCVEAISFETCVDESAALARESELLLSLKPKYNRAGTFRPPPRFLNWRAEQAGLALRLTLEPEVDFASHGPLLGGANYFLTALARLLWWAMHPGRCLFELPPGWIHGHVGKRVIIQAEAVHATAAPHYVKMLVSGEVEAFAQWIRERTIATTNPNELLLRDEALELVSRTCQTQNWSIQPTRWCASPGLASAAANQP